MLNSQEIYILRKENSHLKTAKTKLHISELKKQEKIEELEKENKKLKDELKKVQAELERIKKQRDKYKGMIFKPNNSPDTQKTKTSSKKKIGGQAGHRGDSRKVPERINQIKRVFAQVCPDCGDALKRTDSSDAHTVEDISSLGETKTKITQYECERQWCKNCSKEIKATPGGVIPYSRLGIHLTIQILVWKYVFR